VSKPSRGRRSTRRNRDEVIDGVLAAYDAAQVAAYRIRVVLEALVADYFERRKRSRPRR
jgi:hypothetical protein